MIERRRLLKRTSAALAAIGLTGYRGRHAWAADAWPARPIAIIVPASPGGAIDITARLIAARLTLAYDQPVKVDNKPGATGIIGEDFVAKAPPDGYTLGLVASSHAINPGMFARLPFDTVKSFEPIVQTHSVPLMLVVSNTLPVRSVAELIAYAKAHPGELNFASSGKGGAPHMSGELFKSMADIDLVHVPYKGSTAAHPDLISGRASMMFDTVAAIGPQARSGNVRALAVTTARRVPTFPELPTISEAGLKGYETTTWGGLLAPATTPRTVIDRLNADANRALSEPEVRDKLTAAGIDVVGGSSRQFAEFIDAEIQRWTRVARDAHIQPE